MKWIRVGVDHVCGDYRVSPKNGVGLMADRRRYGIYYHNEYFGSANSIPRAKQMCEAVAEARQKIAAKATA